jgi:hypothetical protein
MTIPTNVSDAFYEKLGPLDERIIETPAKTLEGIRAKARAVAWYYGGADSSPAASSFSTS